MASSKPASAGFFGSLVQRVTKTVESTTGLDVSTINSAAKTVLKVGKDRASKLGKSNLGKIAKRLEGSAVGRSVLSRAKGVADKVDMIQKLGGVRTVEWIDADADARERWLAGGGGPPVGAVEVVVRCGRGVGGDVATETLGLYCRVSLEGRTERTAEVTRRRGQSAATWGNPVWADEDGNPVAEARKAGGEEGEGEGGGGGEGAG